MRLIVSAGHGLKDPGAVNHELGLLEHLHAYQVAWFLRDALERAGHTATFVSCFQSLGDKIINVNWLHAQNAVDLAIEIHFNSAVDPNANGTECLYHSLHNRELAARISGKVSAALGTRDRGAVRRLTLGWLKATTPPAVIVEVLFLSNDSEAATMILKQGFHATVARAIAEGVK